MFLGVHGHKPPARAFCGTCTDCLPCPAPPRCASGGPNRNCRALVLCGKGTEAAPRATGYHVWFVS